jgi:hypothetical protein
MQKDLYTEEDVSGGEGGNGPHLKGDEGVMTLSVVEALHLRGNMVI